ncbi:hypothetical protein D8676_17845 [Mesorhizobium sp. YM1C-6-2]|nr:hypothetical protein D8676_17845 [Mesorhizobium sp. YM1C-6-2]
MRAFPNAVVILLLFVTGTSAQDDGCSKETLEIREKAEDGSTLRLEFGSRWAIDRAEWPHTRVWLRLERVHICKGGLRKERTRHVVNAVRVE